MTLLFVCKHILQIKLILLLHAIVLLVGRAADCFSNSRLPKILGSKMDPEMDNNSYYYSITANNEAMYLGGWTEDSDIRNDNGDGLVITRIEIATMTIVWSMFYSGDSTKIELTNGLALNPDGSKLAIWAYN